MRFDRSVFVNCPFDAEYVPLLRPLLFTIIYLGFSPRIASARIDSGQPRISKIIKLIRESKYGVHDLSRLKAKKVGEYYRLNMPFELGLDVGCRGFSARRWLRMRCLILEEKRYRYQAALSDLSNSDIAVHERRPQKVVSVVREWLNESANLSSPGPTRIWGAFNDFMADNYDALKKRGFSNRDIERLAIGELVKYMHRWVRTRTDS